MAKMSEKAWEGSAEDEREDKILAKKHGMSFDKWEKSSMDVKHDKQQSMKGLKKGGAFKTLNPMMSATTAVAPTGPGSVARKFLGKAKGGSVSARADGIAQRGKTKGKMI